jgi:hypothetical protein
MGKESDADLTRLRAERQELDDLLGRAGGASRSCDAAAIAGEYILPAEPTNSEPSLIKETRDISRG